LDDLNKPCLKCTLKHLLNAKTFLIEAISFGAKPGVEVEDLSNITLRLCNYILDEKGGVNAVH